MEPMPPAGAIWADATLGLPVDDLDVWRVAWCGTCRHAAPACPLSGVLDTGYTPPQIRSTIEGGTTCTHHSPTGQPDEPISPPAMPDPQTERRPTPGPGGKPIQFYGPPAHMPVTGTDQSGTEVVPGHGEPETQ